jgi:hypothetical protein
VNKADIIQMSEILRKCKQNEANKTLPKSSWFDETRTGYNPTHLFIFMFKDDSYSCNFNWSRLTCNFKEYDGKLEDF